MYFAAGGLSQEKYHKPLEISASIFYGNFNFRFESNIHQKLVETGFGSKNKVNAK